MSLQHLYGFIAVLLYYITCAYTQCSSPIGYHLTAIEAERPYSGLASIDCIYVINLSERPERWQSAQKAFAEHGLHPVRFSAINGWRLSDEKRRSLLDPRLFTSPAVELNGGEVGCLLSHISIYQDASEKDFSTVWICEDDIRLEPLVHALPDIIEELTMYDPDWDVLYTDYTRMGSHEQRHRPDQEPFSPIDIPCSKTLTRIHGRYGTHSMIFSRKGLEKALSYFCSHFLWAPIDVDLQYANLREYSVRESISKIVGFVSDTQPWSPLRYQKAP